MKKIAVILAGIFVATSAYANSVTITMMATDSGKKIGTVTAKDTPKGLLLTPHLMGLTPGAHGFHIHQDPSCGEKGMAAGGHLDPADTKEHRGPFDKDGHLGDLPVLMADKNGNATTPVFAPRLTVSKIKGHSLMIHAGGDNYSDTPEKLGGGGARVVCGVIEKAN